MKWVSWFLLVLNFVILWSEFRILNLGIEWDFIGFLLFIYDVWVVHD